MTRLEGEEEFHHKGVVGLHEDIALGDDPLGIGLVAQCLVLALDLACEEVAGALLTN